MVELELQETQGDQVEVSWYCVRMHDIGWRGGPAQTQGGDLIRAPFHSQRK